MGAISLGHEGNQFQWFGGFLNRIESLAENSTWQVISASVHLLKPDLCLFLFRIFKLPVLGQNSASNGDNLTMRVSVSFWYISWMLPQGNGPVPAFKHMNMSGRKKCEYNHKYPKKCGIYFIPSFLVSIGLNRIIRLKNHLDQL